MTHRPTPQIEPIPERPSLPLLGHALDVPSGVDGLLHVMAEARELGPLYKLRIFDREINFVSGPELVAELSDETRFRKNLHPDLVLLRDIGGDGLFTAHNDEPNWRKAHDVLMPAFSLGAMRGYHATMLEVARTLISKWDAAAGTGAVDVAEDMTRLTFDTIGLCGFGYDFDSFGREQAHPFVTALNRALDFAQAKGEGLPWAGLFQWKKSEQYRADLAYMKDLVDEVIRRRKASGDTGTDDLLGRMLHTRDERTGEPLDDVNIRNQAITFLIAGHETTSGALSFALHYLTKHPEVLARAQAEVDGLWGDVAEPEPDYGDLGKLPYLRQILNESLRLWPTAPVYAVEPLADTVIGGRYAVRQGEGLLVLIPQLHRDPAWGDNVELFDPERFAPDREAARPVHLFKPFGNGERACIGRQFALHEATLVLALIVHRYRLIDHTNYQLSIKQSLTLKPAEFTLRLARRTSAERRLPAAETRPAESAATGARTRRAAGTALTLLHGSNLGTCTGIAQDLAADGEERGFAPAVAALNEAAGKLSVDGSPVVIVAASYNGRPTDDAARFLAWTEGLAPGSLTGLEYAVLGVGDRNWAATYQRVPVLIDERLAAAGGTRLLARGAADAAGDFAGTVEKWTADLWSALLARHGTATAPADPADPAHGEAETAEGLYELTDVVESVTGELAARHGVQPMLVLESRELVDLDHPLGRSKRFLRVRLPEGVTYRTGDHFAVLPRNPEHLVQRVADRFGLDLDRTVRIKARRRSRHTLPVDRPLTLRRLLTDFVELQDPATPEQVAVLAEHTACPPERGPLTALAAAEDFAVRLSFRSLLDLLEWYPACELPFPRFLEMLPVMRARHYSISSSALAAPGEVDLMVSLLSAPHRSGEGAFHGIASHYLQTLAAGDLVQARVLAAGDAFRLPDDPAIPVIMVSAGTGVAPFRGAVLDRVHTGNRGPMVLYFGCDHPDVDHLHREEMMAAQAAGAVHLRPAFSRAPEHGAPFVQHRIAADGEDLWELLRWGGRVYVCGDGRRMAPAVREAFQDIYRKHTGGDAEQAAAWLAELQESDRYVEDVWAG